MTFSLYDRIRVKSSGKIGKVVKTDNNQYTVKFETDEYLPSFDESQVYSVNDLEMAPNRNSSIVFNTLVKYFMTDSNCKQRATKRHQSHLGFLAPERIWPFVAETYIAFSEKESPDLVEQAKIYFNAQEQWEQLEVVAKH